MTLLLLLALCLAGITCLCVAYERALTRTESALEESVLAEGRARDELSRTQAALVESERRRGLALGHAWRHLP